MTQPCFLLFMGGRYYPYGGAEDLQGGYASETEAWLEGQKRLENFVLPWVHIFDMQLAKIVRKWDYNIELGCMEEEDPA